jgi:DNA-binding NarL/FixJ family response regulator
MSGQIVGCSNNATRSGTLRVLISEACPIVSGRLRSAVESLPTVEMVWEANNYQRTLELMVQHRPEVMIVSVSLPPDGGFEILRCSRRTNSNCNVILTTRGPEPFVHKIGLMLGAIAVCALTGDFEQISRTVVDMVKLRIKHS